MNKARISECPHHPAKEYWECHHSGDDFVAVWFDADLMQFLCTYGTVGKRGSITAPARTELPYMLDLLQGKVAGSGD